MFPGIIKWLPISGNAFFLGGGKEKVGLASNLLEMSHMISVYYYD